MQTLVLSTKKFPTISFKIWETWARRARTRVALAKLDNAALQDIGVSFRQAHKEANKPFWL